MTFGKAVATGLGIGTGIVIAEGIYRIIRSFCDKDRIKKKAHDKAVEAVDKIFYGNEKRKAREYHSKYHPDIVEVEMDYEDYVRWRDHKEDYDSDFYDR